MEANGRRMIVLGIETSCDETAAAVVTGSGEILSSVVSSQVDLHSVYGGVVPEIASRAHLELLIPVIDQALRAGATASGVKGATASGVERIAAEMAVPDVVAATVGPGLAGALLVGASVGNHAGRARRSKFSRL